MQCLRVAAVPSDVTSCGWPRRESFLAVTWAAPEAGSSELVLGGYGRYRGSRSRLDAGSANKQE